MVVGLKLLEPQFICKAKCIAKHACAKVPRWCRESYFFLATVTYVAYLP